MKKTLSKLLKNWISFLSVLPTSQKPAQISFPIHKNVSLCNFLNSSLLTMALSKFQRLTSADIIVFCHPIIQLNIVIRAGFVLSRHSYNLDRKRSEIQYFTTHFTRIWNFSKPSSSLGKIFKYLLKCKYIQLVHTI